MFILVGKVEPIDNKYRIKTVPNVTNKERKQNERLDNFVVCLRIWRKRNGMKSGYHQLTRIATNKSIFD